jgi:predicted DNA-binding protein (MmcQ/YjbR family)
VNIESFRKYCLAKKGVTEEMPFGDNVLVFKVMGKMFALTSIDNFESISLKCDPEEGAGLREEYPGVQAAYHLNKRHWIMVLVDGSIGDKLLRSWVDNSYKLVVSGLTKSDKLALNSL